jgi:hypothetical protein
VAHGPQAEGEAVLRAGDEVLGCHRSRD